MEQRAAGVGEAAALGDTHEQPIVLSSVARRVRISMLGRQGGAPEPGTWIDDRQVLPTEHMRVLRAGVWGVPRGQLVQLQGGAGRALPQMLVGLLPRY